MTHKKKKTLSDNISFLLSNTSGKLVNPDEDINTESRARVVDEEDLEGDVGDTVVAPSQLRQKNVALLDALDHKYRGGVTSRKSLRNSDSESDEEQSKDYSENSDDDDHDDGSDADFEETSLRDSEDDAIANIKKKGSESFASFTDFNDYDEDNDDNNDESDAVDEEDDEGSDEEEESTSGDGIQHFSTKDSNAEVLKGQAVRNQIGVWDALMECRIQLQKLSVYSNQLPQANVMSIFRSQGGGSFNSSLGRVQNSLTKLLESLLNLQENLLKKYPETKDLSKTTARLQEVPDDDGMDEEIPSSDDERDDDGSVKEEGSDSDGDGEDLDDHVEGEDDNVDKSSIVSDEGDKLKRKSGTITEKPSKRRKLSDYSNLLAKHHKDFTPYRNSIIQKWNTKTQVAVGRASSKNFSAFEQSTLQQIEHILGDKPRLIRRTQLKRSDFRVLGQVKVEEEKPLEQVKESLLVQDVPVIEDKKTVESNKEYDPEIFDDTDFYHQLLRELIEKKTADVTDPVQLGRQWIELQKMRSKMKRKVDVKASKGRRLRYSVHPKLVNFMAPQPELAWSEDAKNELYASLFGQRKT